jgi:hypothetical protein
MHPASIETNFSKSPNLDNGSENRGAGFHYTLFPGLLHKFRDLLKLIEKDHEQQSSHPDR